MPFAPPASTANRVSALLLTLVGAVWIEPPAAHACTAPTPGIRTRHVFPSDKASAVPLNARVLVFYGAHSSVVPIDQLGSDLELVTEHGAPVLVTREATTTATNAWDRQIVVILQPREPLAAGRRFEIRDRRHVPCGPPYGSDPPCALGTPTSFASFTTGSATDVTPPTFAGLSALTAGSREVCDGSGCCGAQISQLFAASWQPSVDDVAGKDVLYNVYAAGTLLVGLQRETMLSLAVQCNGPGSSPFAVRTHPGPHTVRAVDWAGNEDTNTVSLAVPATACASVADGGAGDVRPPATPDAGSDQIAPDGAPTDVALPDSGPRDSTAADAASGRAPADAGPPSDRSPPAPETGATPRPCLQRRPRRRSGGPCARPATRPRAAAAAAPPVAPAW